jgi:hypothetical protein
MTTIECLECLETKTEKFRIENKRKISKQNAREKKRKMCCWGTASFSCYQPMADSK